jgi:hypothetical protein
VNVSLTAAHMCSSESLKRLFPNDSRVSTTFYKFCSRLFLLDHGNCILTRIWPTTIEKLV